MSQSELAKLVSKLAGHDGIHETTVSHWERGESSPGGALLPAVARALQSSIDALYVEAEAA